MAATAPVVVVINVVDMRLLRGGVRVINRRVGAEMIAPARHRHRSSSYRPLGRGLFMALVPINLRVREALLLVVIVQAK